MRHSSINITNRRARFDYELLETFTAGIVLTGTEIKSIRLGKVSLVDTYCRFQAKGLWVRNMHITPYFYGTYNNPDSQRDRQLLLNKKELRRIERMTRETGYTIIPVRLFINEKGLAKMVIAVARGKRKYDKRQSLKEREDKRSIERQFKK